jgi:hypothetical protein
MKELLKSTLFLVLAILVFPILSLVGIIYTTIKHSSKFNYSLSKQLAPIVKSIALSIDGLANACSGELMNDTLLKKKKNGELYSKTYKYGKWDDTISAVTGVNEKRGTLNLLGEDLTDMLSLVLEQDHSINSIKKSKTYK